MRSLAFLAATFAIVFGTLLPTAVAASAATEEARRVAGSRHDFFAGGL